MGRRIVLLLVGAAMAVCGLAAAGVAWAQDSGTVASPVINPTPDEAWMTNGVVYSIVRHGDYVYVGGKFTRVRSAATGGKSFAATNLARFHAGTGVGDPSWTPDVTGADMTTTQVYELVAAGGNIWVGGAFGAIDGVARQNLAAVSPETGAVDADVDPLVGSTPTSGKVRAMLVSGTKVYVGGGFTQIDGKSRRNLAAFDLSGNLDAAWRPKTNNTVRSLAFSCDGATVFAGGQFRSASGSSDGTVYSPREQVARFQTATGALDPWATPAGIVGNTEVASDLAVTCGRVTVPFLGPNRLRSFRLDDGNVGTVAWDLKLGGDPQAVEMLNADELIVGGHFSQVERVKRTRIAQLNLSDGSVDPWNPRITGKDDGGAIGPWDLLVDEGHLYVGGGFYEVTDPTTQTKYLRTNFARFAFAG